MALVEETLFGKRDKVEMALARLRIREPKEGYYVAFSGGKDSCVVLDLVKRAGVKYDAHYNLTTVDPPELVYFIRENYPDVIKEMPKKTMWQMIMDYNVSHMKTTLQMALSALNGGHAKATGMERKRKMKNLFRYLA